MENNPLEFCNCCITCFKNKHEYKRGDFSFIRNKKNRKILEHDYKAVNKLNEYCIDGWEMLRYNNFCNTFRNKHCSNKINRLRSNSLTQLEIKEIIKKPTIWDTILVDNEIFIKNINIPKFKSDLDMWDTPRGKDWEILYSLIHKHHTEETYNKSIRNLSIIANYGWEIFVKKYPIF